MAHITPPPLSSLLWGSCVFAFFFLCREQKLESERGPGTGRQVLTTSSSRWRRFLQQLLLFFKSWDSSFTSWNQHLEMSRKQRWERAERALSLCCTSSIHLLTFCFRWTGSKVQFAQQFPQSPLSSSGSESLQLLAVSFFLPPLPSGMWEVHSVLY